MWTPVARTSDLKSGKPLPANYRGTRLVLWRKRDGSIGALRDACGHRGIPLSKGEVIDDTIRCGYHHYCFDAQGKCVKTPGMLRLDEAYRASCKVLPFYVKEAWGLLWISGESEKEHPFPMPDEDVAYVSDILPVMDSVTARGCRFFDGRRYEVATALNRIGAGKAQVAVIIKIQKPLPGIFGAIERAMLKRRLIRIKVDAPQLASPLPH
jgi:nitrite reductase/ring-hydroxylating ferredoxin subunit